MSAARLPARGLVSVVGTSYRQDAVREVAAHAKGSGPFLDEIGGKARRVAEDQFDGRWFRAELVREPENEHDPNAVAVFDAARTLQAGYVPADVAPALRGDEQALSIWEFRGEDGTRIGLRVLLAPADAWIQEPRA